MKYKVQLIPSIYREASPEQIRQMIKDSDGDVFEEMRTLQQDLTFESAQKAFKRYKVDFAEDKFIALGLRNLQNDQSTNLALLHRDYSYSGSIIINVNDECMEFVSIGGLLPGLSAEDIRSGISQPRNRRLAEIFHRLRLIESYGTGIRKIYALYKNCPIQPNIEVTHNTFKLILPNMNVMPENKIEKKENVESEKNLITPQMRMVLDYRIFLKVRISVKGENLRFD